MTVRSCLKQAGELLYWAMLAACTVGPGTVVTCSRSGAEYGLALSWTLLFATVLAFILQEGTARLTITSGKSLGQCLKLKYRKTFKIYNVALMCWFVVGSVFIGNLFYELNNWAGGVDAVLAFPGAAKVSGWKGEILRVGICIGYGIVTVVLLWHDKLDLLGIILGFVMMCMVVLFVTVVVKIGINWTEFGNGLLPNIPDSLPNRAQPTDLFLSLVGTTAIGFNLFLGGEMAKGRLLRTAQQGILFSVASALIVSLLIMMVGAGQYNASSTEGYSIQGLSRFIEKFTGTGGVVVFALGFMAAALSSMVTVILGVKITSTSIFFDEDYNPKIIKSHTHTQYQRYTKVDGDAGLDGDTAVQKSEYDLEDVSRGVSGVDDTTKVNKVTVGESKQIDERWKYIMNQVITLFMTLTSVVVIAANADRLFVILVAQVLNGALLPFFSICLLLCINDLEFMGSKPQNWYANIFLFSSVVITLFLACNTILLKVLGSKIALSTRLYTAIATALAGMLAVSLLTTLGKDIVESFRRIKRNREAEAS